MLIDIFLDKIMFYVVLYYLVVFPKAKAHSYTIYLQVSCYPIPTHKKSKIVELESIYVKEDDVKWLDAICKKVKEVRKTV